MAYQPIRNAPSSEAQADSLPAAFRQAISFPVVRAAESALSPASSQAFAAEEAAFGRVAIDGRGLTAGMRLHVAEPVRAVVSAWRDARAPFDRLLTPHMKNIEAIDRLESQVAELEQNCEAEIVRREQQLETDTAYVQIRQRHDRAEARFEEKFAENNQRVATIWAYHWSYWAALCCVGVAEWLINYDTFYLFMRVPAIAAGATIILAVLLAFAADGHGTLLKQWSHRFGAHRTPAQRLGDWRLFGFSTFSLMLVLAAAGGSRYAAAVRSLAANVGPNVLGDEARIDVNPLRDVLISLLANLGAWALGVFLAYRAHDSDPEYMEATAERTSARARYNRRRALVNREFESIRARYGKQVTEAKNAARARSRDVEEERSLLLQVREHEKALLNACQATLLANANRYRDQLIQTARQQPTALTFVRAADGQTLTPYEYKSTPILVDLDLVREML